MKLGPPSSLLLSEGQEYAWPFHPDTLSSPASKGLALFPGPSVWVPAAPRTLAGGDLKQVHDLRPLGNKEPMNP